MQATVPSTLESAEKEKIKERLRVPFLVLLGSVVLGSSAYFDLPDYINAVKSSQWPVVTGKIEKSDVEISKIKLKDPAFNPIAEYTYEVNGVKYTGTRIKWQRDVGLVGYDAFKLKDQYSAGMAVAVRYESANPQNSVIDPYPSIFRVFSHFVLYCLFAIMVYFSTYPRLNHEEFQA